MQNRFLLFAQEPLDSRSVQTYGDIIKWKHFPHYWPFLRGIHRSPVNSPHKGPWRGALMFSLICAWTNAWVNNRDGDDLRRHRAHNVVPVMGTCYMMIKRQFSLGWHCGYVIDNKMKMPCRVDSCVKCLGIYGSKVYLIILINRINGWIYEMLSNQIR